MRGAVSQDTAPFELFSFIFYKETNDIWNLNSALVEFSFAIYTVFALISG